MSSTEEPPVAGSNFVVRCVEALRSAAPLILTVITVASFVVAILTFWMVWSNNLETRLSKTIDKVETDNKDARKESELARKETETRLMALIDKAFDNLKGLVSATSADLSGLVDRTSVDLQGFLAKNSAEVSEARREISAAASQLTIATVLTSNLSRELGSHATEITRIKQDTAQLEPMKKELTDNTSETRRIKNDTSDIQSIKASVATIQNQLQSTKSHVERHVESFGVTPGTFHSGTYNGRIIAFPLTSEKDAAKELEEKGFTKTRSRLRGTELQAFIPPRRGVNDLPAVLDQSILTISIASRSAQTPSQPSSHPTENQPSPEPGGSR
jgi:myosin heavy subunit